ncbi:MAG: hypothetical protein ACLPWF_25535 [Bryobacteraceae bacterium]
MFDWRAVFTEALASYTLAVEAECLLGPKADPFDVIQQAHRLQNMFMAQVEHRAKLEAKLARPDAP